MVPVTSRYYGIEVVQLTTSDGRMLAYFRRRFLPAAANAVVMTEHEVTQGERLDNITARYLGDPEQFWRLCDANNAMNPADLTSEIGLRLRVIYPQF